MKKRLLFVLVVLSLVFAGCSSDKAAKKSNEKNASPKVTEKEIRSKFIVGAKAVCEKIDRDTLDAINDSSIQDDIDAIAQALADIEDELDKAISGFENLNPTAKNSDDWETFLDDMSAIRDNFSNLIGYLQDVTSIQNEMMETSDPAQLETLQSDLEDGQYKVEAVFEDMEQRETEIKSLAKTLGLGDSCDL